MATPLDLNNLKTYRRHITTCASYPGRTFKPETITQKNADTCACPIWCDGYLSKETTKNSRGKTKAKRVRASLDTNDWTVADSEVAKLYAAGCLPKSNPSIAATAIDPKAVTVEYSCKRFLASRSEGLNPRATSTQTQTKSFIEKRLLPYRAAKGIIYVREFENYDVCLQFTESWRQQSRKPGEKLGPATAEVVLQRFECYLNFCKEAGWIEKSGAAKIETAKVPRKVRFGLELDEFQQLMNAPPLKRVSELADRETRVITQLMRWSGLRECDAHKFNDSEVVRNVTGDGWNCKFIQQKTGTECTVPMPDHVKAQLDALPGRMQDGKKYYFTSTLKALIDRVNLLAKTAQSTKPFKHHFSPHCLRHTFAIQLFNHGTPIEVISRYLGHSSIKVTEKAYWNLLDSSHRITEAAYRQAVAAMMSATS